MTQDYIWRAQARALIKVLSHYELDLIAHKGFRECRTRVQAYGIGEPSGSDLSAMAREFHDLAFEACLGRMNLKQPGYALVMALFLFCERNSSFRFLGSANSIAVALGLMRQIPAPHKVLESEILERLEDVFETEIKLGLAA